MIKIFPRSEFFFGALFENLKFKRVHAVFFKVVNHSVGRFAPMLIESPLDVDTLPDVSLTVYDAGYLIDADNFFSHYTSLLNFLEFKSNIRSLSRHNDKISRNYTP